MDFELLFVETERRTYCLLAGPERLFVRVHDAMVHCRAAEIRSKDIGQGLSNGRVETNRGITRTNGEYSHATHQDDEADGLNVPLLVEDSLDNF